MKVTEKKLDDGRILLEALVSPAEVSHAFSVTQMGFAQQMGIVPQKDVPIAKTIEQRTGIRDVDEVVQQQAVEYLVPFAVDKRNIVPAFPAKASHSEPIKRGKPFSFEACVTPKPEYELTSYDPVEITVPKIEVSEEEVDFQIAQMAESYATFEPDAARPVREGDSMVLSLKATQDGKNMEGLSTDGRLYMMGMGLMPEEFDRQLVGMQVGEEKKFSLEAPDGQSAPVDCTVVVKEIQKKIVPEIDDAWVAKNLPGCENVETMRTWLQDRMLADRSVQIEALKSQLAVAEITNRFEGDISDEVYEAMRSTVLTNLRMQAQQQGLSFEEFVNAQGGEQQFAVYLMAQTHAMLVQGYALDAVFRHERLSLTEADIEQTCRQMNAQDPQAARREMEANGQAYALREAAERMKANKWLVEHAIVKEEAPSEDSQA